MPTAILVDAGFFLKRIRKVYPDKDHANPQTIATLLHRYAFSHLRQGNDKRELYRVFVYDCPPVMKTLQNPVSGKQINFSKTATSIFRNGLHEELKKKRKVALRLGHIQESNEWKTSPQILKGLISGKMNVSDLKPEDISPDFKQKGVDIKIGIDIASLTYKKLVDQIILISGDSDFVPAAKLARREGIDFILDPMWNPIMPSLFEHIDGLKSNCPNPVKPKPPAQNSLKTAA